MVHSMYVVYGVTDFIQLQYSFFELCEVSTQSNFHEIPWFSFVPQPGRYFDIYILKFIALIF